MTVWFSAVWHLTSGKGGISATELQREMQLGSYQTAWAMLHRYRSVMVRPGRDRLTGDVEVDEAFLGGPEPGITGRGALGKIQFAAAVELNSPSGLGRVRLGVIEDARADSLQRFLLDNVQPGSTIVTDGWASYPKATRGHYTLKTTNVTASGRPAHEALPGVHLVFSLVKRWVMGTLHGSVSQSTSRRTSTSGCSASTAATHAAEVCCSSGCSSKPSKATPSPTRSSARLAAPAQHRPHRSVPGCSRRASNSRSQACLGAGSDPERFQWLRHRDGDPT